MVKEKLHIFMSVSAIGRFLKKRDLEAEEWIPACQADTARQREFYDGTLLPFMKETENGDIALLFLDVSHFVMRCNFLGFIYGRVRRFALAFSGRMCYNVLGAMDFVTREVLTVTSDKYIN